MPLATPCLIHLPEREYELFCLAENSLSSLGNPKACSLLGPGLHSESGWDSHPNPAPPGVLSKSHLPFGVFLQEITFWLWRYR